MIKVFGHKSPDTDTVCSAIAYAWVLNKKGEKASAYRLGELNNETKYVLKKFRVATPVKLERLNPSDKVVIIDTNNPEELPENINDTEIVTIIDHHKLVGGLSTHNPIPVVIKPWGSTASIVWKHLKHQNLKVTNDIYGLLLCAILSDTLNLTSPTTTDKDKQAVSELKEILGVDTDKLASEIFEAKSDLTGFTPADILNIDSKVFNFNGKNTRISVLETTNPYKALKYQSKLEKAMESMKKVENISYMFFFIVDILQSHAMLLLPSNDEIVIATEAFNQKPVKGIIQLPGVVSRKKQIVPVLEKAIK